MNNDNVTRAAEATMAALALLTSLTACSADQKPASTTNPEGAAAASSTPTSECTVYNFDGAVASSPTCVKAVFPDEVQSLMAGKGEKPIIKSYTVRSTPIELEGKCVIEVDVEYADGGADLLKAGFGPSTKYAQEHGQICTGYEAAQLRLFDSNRGATYVGTWDQFGHEGKEMFLKEDLAYSALLTRFLCEAVWEFV